MYYVFDDGKNKFEGMTREQIIAAIAQATGVTPQDVDSGFITTIKEQNANKGVSLWVGTQQEYNAISNPDENTLYCITDPNETAELQNEIEILQAQIAEFVATETSNITAQKIKEITFSGTKIAGQNQLAMSETIESNDAIVLEAKWRLVFGAENTQWENAKYHISGTDINIQTTLDSSKIDDTNTYEFKVVYSIPQSADNAELTDIRVAADGYTYQSAGEAVRTQIKEVKQILMSMLIPILRQGLYGENQNEAINMLESALTAQHDEIFTIQNALSNVTTNNSASVVMSGAAYSATLTAETGMEITSVSVTMGGMDIASTAYSNGEISIAAVTGNVVIMAVAETLIETYTPEMADGYINVTNGNVGGTSSYKHTQIIPVREGDKVYGTCYDSSSQVANNGIPSRFTAAYDENESIYASGGNGEQANYKETSPYVVAAGVYGVVFSVLNRYANDVIIYVDKSERSGA